jgi:hypothetical protein
VHTADAVEGGSESEEPKRTKIKKESIHKNHRKTKKHLGKQLGFTTKEEFVRDAFGKKTSKLIIKPSNKFKNSSNIDSTRRSVPAFASCSF